MNILLTGASGFLGSHLARAFVGAGHHVTVAVRRTSALDRLAAAASQVTRATVDDMEALCAVNADLVVHAATCYGRRGESLTEMEQANVALPSVLLEAAAKRGAVAFINVDTTLPPTLNAYASSKARFAERAREIAKGRVRVVNVRLESLYGPGDDDTKFPTYAVRSLLANVPELRMTQGEQERDFLYIEDATRAFSLLADAAAAQREWWLDYGLGSGRAISMREFVETAKRETGAKTSLLFGALPYRPGEIMRSVADIKALGDLGWRPTIGLTEGLRRMIAAERSQ